MPYWSAAKVLKVNPVCIILWVGTPFAALVNYKLNNCAN